MSNTRYSELGGFLRSRRERIRPEEVGIAPGPRRRVPGLRRDEVAVLAGASVEYYTELERGAGSQPSDQMLAALARALRLGLDERDHLYRLADRPVPGRGGAASHVYPAMLDLLTRIDGTPAMVSTDLHTVLVQNPLAVALLGDLSAHRGRAASFIHRWFTDPAARRIYPREDLAPQSRSFVADLRAAVGRRSPGDAEAAGLVDDLSERSPEFRELWAAQDVGVRRDERKRIVHPAVGLLDLDCLSLFSEDGRQRLLWFAPRAGTDTAEKLALLGVVGTESMRTGPAR
ncbi:helix-turn-helix domain-containing protein [Nocardiopsis changdeensis]|uniref:Helix-turn-helix domain-containing protein n=1 Tax=Nocardiopsis changdeensis TaxID=2831969 RepID=A0ABX8BUR8_9ACTN|nr:MULTISPECIES: helix-turn-helix domain-containing protein [Nocardiopsis]QUX24113.1 helix-turn-helix domain-containing protein [Nocardiopsis changdeensis]QYX34509.1 helix-turn-helix domain-containing protein [Nocardiopsis sp. MT53]